MAKDKTKNHIEIGVPASCYDATIRRKDKLKYNTPLFPSQFKDRDNISWMFKESKFDNILFMPVEAFRQQLPRLFFNILH